MARAAKRLKFDEAFVLPDPANPGGTRTVNFFID